MTAGGITLYLYDKIHVLVNRDHGASHRTSYTRAADHRAPVASANATLPLDDGIRLRVGERAHARDGDVSASKKRTPCTTTAVRLVAAVAVAGQPRARRISPSPAPSPRRPSRRAHRDGQAGRTLDLGRSQLSAHGRFHTTDVPVPPCEDRLADGLDVTIDSSFCFEIDTECVDEECGSLPSADRAAYEAYVADLCVDGVNNDPGHLRYATFDEDLAANGDDDITSDHEPIVTGEPDEDDKSPPRVRQVSRGRRRDRARREALARDVAVRLRRVRGAAPDEERWRRAVRGRRVRRRRRPGAKALPRGERRRACYIGPKESIDFDGNPVSSLPDVRLRAA